MSKVTFTDNGMAVEITDGASAKSAAMADEAAVRAEAALASIIAAPEVGELTTTNVINITDRLVIYRAGTPLLYTGTMLDMDADGSVRFGGGTQEFSTDATISANRVITTTPLGSPHGIASQDILNWSTADLSYAAFDDRTQIAHVTAMGHHISFQNGLKKTGANTMDFIATVYHNPELDAGSVTDNYGVYFAISNIDGATVGRHVGLFMDNIPEHNGSPGNPNYVFLSDGGARARIGGQLTAKKLFISPDEGVAVKNMHVAGAADTEAVIRIQQQGYNTLDLGIPASSIDGRLSMNNLAQWEFDYQTALLPGADNTFNIGKADARIKDTFQVNAATVSSDARLKTEIGYDLAPELVAWAKAIRPARYKMKASVLEKGRESLADELGAAALAKMSADEIEARKADIGVSKNPEADLIRELGEAAIAIYPGANLEIERRGQDLARIRFGFIAQEVYQAGIDAGVDDPCAYGFLCRDAKFVDGVRALDDDGNPDWHWSLRYEELLVFLLMAK